MIKLNNNEHNTIINNFAIQIKESWKTFYFIKHKYTLFSEVYIKSIAELENLLKIDTTLEQTLEKAYITHIQKG